MQLTKAADYAARIMVRMAERPLGYRFTGVELASHNDAPEAFLSKILQTLARAGLIKSRRGVTGGYSLAISAENITLLDVVEAMEGPIGLNACTGLKGSCERENWCQMHEVWLRAQEALVDVLRSESIASLAARPKAVHPECGDVLWR